ncbi:hypothetical protein ACFPYJ_32045 [Paenibacillus solisilvae]|uniref:Exosporium protein C n=1 Tax=Paenibacillus solisilvae TaxID=2486751 RepID=A0ABW0W897_9BACL
MPTVINYNRARLNNITNGTVVTLTPATSPLLLLTMGIYVAAPVSFLEIMSSVGFETPDNDTLVTVRVDVDFVTQGASDVFIATPNSQQLTFHTILENLTVGHHVIQLFASTDADIGIDGPVTMSAWVLA